MLRNSLARCNTRHLRIKRLVQFTFADPVYNNVLKNRAALLCRACGDPPICVAERYLTLRIRGYMSARSASLRKKKSSAVPLFRSGHMSAICARLSQKEVGVKRVETLVSTLLPRRGARRIPALRRAQLPAEVQRKTLRPLGTNTLTQFAHPAQPVQRKNAEETLCVSH